MDGTAHEVAQAGVDHAVAGQQALACKRGANDFGFKVHAVGALDADLRIGQGGKDQLANLFSIHFGDGDKGMSDMTGYNSSLPEPGQRSRAETPCLMSSTPFPAPGYRPDTEPGRGPDHRPDPDPERGPDPGPDPIPERAPGLTPGRGPGDHPEPEPGPDPGPDPGPTPPPVRQPDPRLDADTTSGVTDSLVRSARNVFDIEIRALQALAGRSDGSFEQAGQLLLACAGRVVVSGMGKSGHIGRKIAATLASTGTPSFFVHPGEASHGDLGMITDADVVILISYSGESDELLTIVPALRRQGLRLISMTGNGQSRLARLADVHLDISVAEEACPLGLAPTSSTTATLVMGDALAVSLLEARGFTAEDFARSHPAGSLGRRLLLRISDIMHSGSDIPCVHPDDSMADALVEMPRKGLGMTAVIDHASRVLGVFTDGDLRRTLDDAQIDLRQTPVRTLMTARPKTINGNRLAVEAARMMEAHKIHALLVADADDRLVGALNIHDLLRARVV